MTHPADPARGLRLWPAVTIVALQWLLRFALPLVVPDAMPVAILSGLAGGLLVILWWVLFSRAPGRERLLGTVCLLAAPAVGWRLSDPSVATAMMGLMYFLYVAPVLSLAFVGWALWARRKEGAARLLGMLLAILVPCGLWTLVRSDGVRGASGPDLAWRWTPTSEERLLAQAPESGIGTPSAPATGESAMADLGPPLVAAQWPGFRGPARDSVLRDVAIETDWDAQPPQELWRRAVGPGWSSFAVAGERLYTQEQRGDEELVVCYHAGTGEPLWEHRDPTRFWEANAGAGPRGTPTLSGEQVITFGGTGLLNVLDARDGTPLWSRDVGQDLGIEAPYWGFSSSPWVTPDAIWVGASGTLVAYPREGGEPLWVGPAAGESYSSPQAVTLDGVPQVVLLGEQGANSLALDDGRLLWDLPWSGYPIVQPAQAENGDLLLCAKESRGLVRLTARQAEQGWELEHHWASIRLKPYFNDFVLHDGHAYGFDGSVLACIELEGGERRWKGGRYGNGQALLLAAQDLLLILGEEGQLVLVSAVPEAFTELATFQALEGKTWNHPVLVGERLFVRNDREMVALRLRTSASLGASQ